MAIPSGQEEVVASATKTVEAFVAQAAAEPIKAAKAAAVMEEPTTSNVAAATGTDASTPSIDAAPKAEDAPKTEESAETSSSDQEQDNSEVTPVEPSSPELKEESELVSDLKKSEKKALQEFRLRIEKAIKEGEFQVPEKVVKASKEEGSSKTPKIVLAPAEDKIEETAPIATLETTTETPTAAVETSATPVTDSPAVVPVEENAKVPSPTTQVVGLTAVEKATSTDPKVEQKAVVVPEKIVPKTAPAVAETVEVKSAPVVPEVEVKGASVVAGRVEAKAVVPTISAKVEVRAAPAVAVKVEAKASPVVVEKVDAKVEAKTAPVVAEKEVEAKVAPVVVEKADAKVVAPVAPELETKAAPAIPEKVAAKAGTISQENVEKNADSEEVLAQTTTDEEVAVSQDIEAEVAEAQAEKAPEDISLWGVPLLYTKSDKRTDVVLLKFLRANEFDVKEAFKQLRNTVIWRKTFNADNLLNEDFGTDCDGITYIHGVTRDGEPVCYNVPGVLQDKELYQKILGDAEKLNVFLRERVQFVEKGIQLLTFNLEGPNAMVQITDLKNAPGFGKKEYRHAANQAISLLQDNYPELCSKRVFINVPRYFSAMYAFVSPLLSKRTKSKLAVVPAGNSTEYLLTLISADNIPIQYGGLSRPTDTEFTPGSAPVHELVLRGGKSTQIDVDVTEAGSTVMWDLLVIGFDVTYGAEFVPSAEGSYVSIIEKVKKLSSKTEEPVRNSFKATEPGKVVLSVGNLSRKKKTIIYRYKVIGTPAAAVDMR